MTALKRDVLSWCAELGFQQAGVTDIDLSLAESRQHGAQHVDRGPHLPHQIVGRLRGREPARVDHKTLIASLYNFELI